jgi:hypothetical protein
MNSDMSSVTITRVSTQGVMIETFKRVTSLRRVSGAHLTDAQPHQQRIAARFALGRS